MTARVTRRRTRGVRRKSASELLDFFENACVPLRSVGPSGEILHANRAELELLGYSSEEYLGRHIAEFHADPHVAIDILLRLGRGETLHQRPARLRCKDGSLRHVLISSSALIEDGRFVQSRCITIDVTDQHQGATAGLNRQLAELLPLAVYTCEAPSGVISYHNGKAAELWGRAPRPGDTDERFCGSFKLFLPDGTFLPHEDCPMAVALREEREFRDEEVIVERPDGSRVPILVNIDPIRDSRGRVTGAINVFQDMSRLKQAEQALRERNESLETLLDTVPAAVFIARDPQCSRISGNRAASEILRMPADANFSMTASPEAAPAHFQVLQDGQPVPHEALPIQRAARGEIVRNARVDHRFEDGTLVHTLVSAQPLYDAAGRPRGAVASMLDVTDQVSSEKTLRESDRRKDEFLAVLSHELRNPLAPIRTALNILGDSPAPEAGPFEEMRLVVERQLGQLCRLIDDLLDISRIRRGKFQLQKEPTELAAVIRQALEMSRPLADREAHTVDVALPEEAIYLDADPARLAQVFSNLLNNAYRYTPAGGAIWLTVERRGDSAVASIKDNGIGIPPDKLEAIFEMFSQADSRERSRGGLGIGLPLASQLVSLHGGSLVARSAGAGRGSEFLVELPVLLDVVTSEPVPAEPTPAAPPEPRSERRILVVDDNVDAANMLATLLELEGHEAQMAYEGRRALEQAEALRPEVILLDIGLPEMDGYEVCRRIRREPWGEEILIVALTGWGQEGDRQRSLEAGFDAHLTKPIDRTSLQELLGAPPAEARDARD